MFPPQVPNHYYEFGSTRFTSSIADWQTDTSTTSSRAPIIGNLPNSNPNATTATSMRCVVTVASKKIDRSIDHSAATIATLAQVGTVCSTSHKCPDRTKKRRRREFSSALRYRPTYKTANPANQIDGLPTIASEPSTKHREPAFAPHIPTTEPSINLYLSIPNDPSLCLHAPIA
jgi:hypothetical protein